MLIELQKSYLITESNDNKFAIGVITDGAEFDAAWDWITSAIGEGFTPKDVLEFCDVFRSDITTHPSYQGSSIRSVEPIWFQPLNWDSLYWSGIDQAAALDSGWGIFWPDGTQPQIQRADEVDAFSDDAAATRYVWRIAENEDGCFMNALCRRAIVAIQACYP